MPLLSVCIPTYNRSRFLDRLLKRLSCELASLPIDVEVIVSDNASTDETPAVCARASNELGAKFIFFKQENNIGATSNLEFLFSKASGEYCLYLADDDVLLWEPLLEALSLMRSTPSAVALYAPWYLVDLAADRITGQFYRHPETVSFTSASRTEYARFISKYGVFSEIGIYHTAIRRNLMPVISDVAFWAFTIPVQLMSYGEVIYSNRPFYGSVTQHSGLSPRVQQGHEETMIGWDRYRGGLEYLLGLAGSGIESRELSEINEMAQAMIVDRMIVAIRLRLLMKSDPIETYLLASRVRAYRPIDKLPVPFLEIKIKAALYHLTVDVASKLPANELVLLGYSAEEKGEISRMASIPVRGFGEVNAINANQIVLKKRKSLPEGLERSLTAAAYVIDESTLLAKFP